MKHINALNTLALFQAQLKDGALSPNMVAKLKAQLQRAKRRAERLTRYWHRNMAYPYSSKRQMGLGASQTGLGDPTRPVVIRPINPLHWSGKVFGGLRA